MRTRAGFTLLELVVTIGITSTVLALLLPWVLNLIVMSEDNLDHSALGRAAQAAHATFSADLDALVACPATGTAVHHADATTLAVYSTNDLDDPTAEGTNLVTWTLTDDVLRRSTTPATADTDQCGPTDAEVDPVGDPTTVAWADFGGNVLLSSSATTGGAGVLVPFTTSPEQVRAIRVDLVVSDGTSSIPVRLTRPVPVPYSGLN